MDYKLKNTTPKVIIKNVTEKDISNVLNLAKRIICRYGCL